MEAVHKDSNNILKSIAIGVTGLTLIGGSYLLFKRIQTKRQKDRILKTLTMIRRELFPIVNRMKRMHENYLKQTGERISEHEDFFAEVINLGNSEVCSC